MWPSLREGDAAEVEPLSGPPRVGDVVLARFPHALVLHRVCGFDGRTCTLQGDNVASVDPLLPASRILGKVRRVRRAGAVLEHWDVGPKRLGRLRVRVKRRLAAWWGKGRRA
ncbi:S24/S26 family peptidase [Myxococcaceae bacterium JPH2]|nr:S24/S26 family peptidase [Myxococcaceae bacterium JPH2]